MKYVYQYTYWAAVNEIFSAQEQEPEIRLFSSFRKARAYMMTNHRHLQTLSIAVLGSYTDSKSHLDLHVGDERWQITRERVW